jgi:hypothetical protein
VSAVTAEVQYCSDRLAKLFMSENYESDLL